MAERQVKGGYQMTVPESDEVNSSPATAENVFGEEQKSGVTWCSMPELDPRRLELINTMAAQSGTSIDQWIGKEFTAEHCLLNHWSTIDEDTGEYKEGIRCNLISPAGEVLSFTGKSAIGCIQRLMGEKAIGMPPWIGGLKLLVGQITEGKKRRHTLTLSKQECQRMIALYQGRDKKAPR